MIATHTFEEAMDIGNRKAKAFSRVAVKNPISLSSLVIA